ncbi:MAG: hypothetical protein WAZ15_11775 [Propioniciclava sp.]|jgi:hypothetical protein
MDDRTRGLRRLSAARTTFDLVDALWDLRDSAHDSPQKWSTFSPEEFLQGMTAHLDDLPDVDADTISIADLAAALVRSLTPRTDPAED